MNDTELMKNSIIGGMRKRDSMAAVVASRLCTADIFGQVLFTPDALRAMDGIIAEFVKFLLARGYNDFSLLDLGRDVGGYVHEVDGVSFFEVVIRHGDYEACLVMPPTQWRYIQ